MEGNGVSVRSLDARAAQPPAMMPGTQSGASVLAAGADVVASMVAVRAGLLRAVRDDPSLRASIESLGRWLTALAAEAVPTVESTPPASTPAPTTGASPEPSRARLPSPPGHPPHALTARPTATASGILPLRLGDSRTEVIVVGTSHELIAAQRAAEDETRRRAAAAEDEALESAMHGELPDLALVERRCRLKARACRWSVTRRHKIADPLVDFFEAVKPVDQSLIAEARSLPNCFAWTLHPYAKLPDDEALSAIAATYDNLADVVVAVQSVEGSAEQERDMFREEVFQLLAEAQSALRWGLDAVGTDIDRDQDDAFRWLRRKTETERVFVHRFMRLDDHADFRGWEDLRRRVGNFNERRRESIDGAKARRKAISKVKYICKNIPTWSDDERAPQWRTLAMALDALVNAGEAPSSRELREMLLPIIEQMPDDIDGGAGFHHVMQSLDQYLADQEADPREPSPRERAPTAEVRRLADLLRGTTVLLIGGERRRAAQAALESAFDLAELRWIGTIDHRSIAPFEGEVARPEVALVIIPIRWSNHAFEGIDEFCRKHGKPFVRLPGGYNPNQVAVQVLKQVGSTLEARLERV